MSPQAARDKRERFVALAQTRVSKAMHSIRLVGNLANKANYDYDEEDVRLIVAALEGELRDMRNRFRAVDSARRPQFSLDR